MYPPVYSLQSTPHQWTTVSVLPSVFSSHCTGFNVLPSVLSSVYPSVDHSQSIPFGVLPLVYWVHCIYSSHYTPLSIPPRCTPLSLPSCRCSLLNVPLTVYPHSSCTRDSLASVLSSALNELTRRLPRIYTLTGIWRFNGPDYTPFIVHSKNEHLY